MTVAREAGDTPYVPPRGVFGKLRRLRARTFARHPLDIRLDRPLVSITFDDFPQSAATCGGDALARFGWRGTFYASGSFAGQVTHLGRMFDASDIVRLDGDGHEIGCHSYSHRDAANMLPAELVADVARNEQALQEVGLTSRLVTFAFPYGEATPGAKSELIQRFRALRSVRPGLHRGGDDRAFLKAVALNGGEEGMDRAVAFVSDLARRPGWLILYGHDVRDDPSPWGCTPAELARVLDAVAASGATVLPVREALDRIGA